MGMTDAGLTTYQWITLGLGCAGFIGTWILGAFKLGAAVEQMKSSVKEQIDEEREKIIEKLDALEAQFQAEQKSQDHNFGEVGAAMRQYIADVEKMVREVEIFGRDHYVQKEDFKEAVSQIGTQIREGNAEIKADLKELQKQLAQRN